MISNIKNQFMLDQNTIFLNHGSFGACAKPVYKDLLKWQEKLENEPVLFFEETIYEALLSSRIALGKYLNCHPDDLVYFTNPTTAINAVARSLELKPGDEVLSTNHIYGALDRSWEYICNQKKAKFVKAFIPFPILSKNQFMDYFKKSISDKTRVIFISHITSMTAMKFPVEEVIELAKNNNILSIIDGAHVPGHIDLDIKKLDPDIYTGACHKWMCTPKGVSFLYVKKKIQKSVHPLVVSWGWNSENPSKSVFLDWHQWQGTRDMSAFLTIPMAIEFLKKYNWEKLAIICKEKVPLIRNEFLNLLDFPLPCPDSWLGQMASIPLPITDAISFKKKLLEEYNIQIPIFSWNSKVYLRYSIQVYNTESDLNKLLFAVKELLN